MRHILPETQKRESRRRQDGPVEGDGEFEGGRHGGKASDVEFGAQGSDTVFDGRLAGVAGDPQRTA
jgi:hypothetical protein